MSKPLKLTRHIKLNGVYEAHHIGYPKSDWGPFGEFKGKSGYVRINKIYSQYVHVTILLGRFAGRELALDFNSFRFKKL